jgi:hypothetical protein
MYFEKGIGGLRGYFTVTDKNGDKLLWELPEAGAKPSPPNPVKGTVKVVGGTGKFTGIQGSMEWAKNSSMGAGANLLIQPFGRAFLNLDFLAVKAIP